MAPVYCTGSEKDLEEDAPEDLKRIVKWMLQRTRKDSAELAMSLMSCCLLGGSGAQSVCGYRYKGKGGTCRRQID